MNTHDEDNSPAVPLAYFITFTCHGTWLHGDERGSVDLHHHEPGTPFLAADPRRHEAGRQRLGQAPYVLDAPRRRIVLQAIRGVCDYRGWMLHAAHVRTTHLHAVVGATKSPERVMNDFKAYASRALNAARLDPPQTQRWTRHGSTRYLWNAEQVQTRIHYTLHEQGTPLEMYDGSCANSDEPSRERQRAEATTLANARGSDTPTEPRALASGNHNAR